MTLEAYFKRQRKKKRSSIWNTGWDEDLEEIPLVDNCCPEELEKLDTIIGLLQDIKDCVCTDSPLSLIHI